MSNRRRSQGQVAVRSRLLACANDGATLATHLVNVGKRLIKSPKVYLRDSGVLHALLGVATLQDLQGHPIAGASWKGLWWSRWPPYSGPMRNWATTARQPVPSSTW